MRPGDLQLRSATHEVAGELEHGGAGRPAEIARRLGRDWTEDRVRDALAELFSAGVVGHSDEVGFWWVA
jgi:hypothetical protein